MCSLIKNDFESIQYFQHSRNELRVCLYYNQQNRGDMIPLNSQSASRVGNEGATMPKSNTYLAASTCADEGGGIYAFLLCAMPRIVANILDLRSLFFFMINHRKL